MDRRSFVKVAVGMGAGATLAGSLAAMTRPALIPREAGAGVVTYYGAHRIGGPAPRGVPLIPVRANEEGAVFGKPTFAAPGRRPLLNPDGTPALDEKGRPRIEEIVSLDWYKYCQHQTAPGLELSFSSSNVCTYFASEDKLRDPEVSRHMWYREKIGSPVNIHDFLNDYDGAPFQWRSEGQTGTSVLTGVLVRLPKKDLRFPQEGLHPPARPIKSSEMQHNVLEECVIQEGDHVFVALSLFCTHFCCAPGWHEAERQAKSREAWDKLFCTCHYSIYDAREIVLYDYTPEPTTKPLWPDTPE